ncbi:MAG: S1 RNA-binding domain-containing protein [Patescibacteria group bacterium]|nr:S1 RNA-binding domain-containing protein [Patescibacteria group bacterium]
MATATKKDSSLMDELLANSPEVFSPRPGDFVTGKIASVLKSMILVDLGGGATGIISGRETCDSSGTTDELKEGDSVSAYVIDDEDKNGLVVLSLRKASQEKTWNKFVEAFESNESISVTPTEANKGGLLIDVDGIKGFIPVSQLAPLHYPRVNGADSAEILKRLQDLVGKKFLVRVINVDYDSNKLILSEKAAQEGARQKALGGLKVGEKIKGKISGLVKFGIFIAFDGLEGLVHISEIAWGHVKDPSEYGKLGDEIEVLVIGIEGDKISLSMKKLTPDPWVDAVQKYKIGDKVSGEVTRLTPFGVFVKLEDEINGLIHISELAPEGVEDISQLVNAGDKIDAKIVSIDPEEHRIGLSVNALTGSAEREAERSALTTGSDSASVKTAKKKAPAKKKKEEASTEEAPETKEK